jgi:3-(3-hydroxy-phenyl)propionate hydroxylase
MRAGSAVTGLRQDADGVMIECADDEGAYALRAAYAVGCDGARSTVRAAIGGGMEDLGFHERWLVADLMMEGERPDLGDYTIQHCHPERAVTQVRGPGLRRRWEIALREETDAEALAPDYLWRRLGRWIAPGDGTVERAAVYTFHSVIAERWRAGRMLIAGDAAHQTPPFMGQGMCAGVRDAANLAWKLAACARRGHDEALLDSYQSERHPNVREYIETAVRLGRLINATDPEGALKAAFRQEDGSYRMNSIRPPLGPGLATGDAAHAGHLFPQPRLADGQLADDRAGHGWTLYAEPGALTSQATAAALARGLAVLTANEAPGIGSHLAGLEAVAALVRPDRYILGAAPDAAGIAALIEVAPI